MEDPEVKNPGRGELAGSVTIHMFVVAELAVILGTLLLVPAATIWIVFGLLAFNLGQLSWSWKRLRAVKQEEQAQRDLVASKAMAVAFAEMKARQAKFDFSLEGQLFGSSMFRRWFLDGSKTLPPGEEGRFGNVLLDLGLVPVLGGPDELMNRARKALDGAVVEMQSYEDLAQLPTPLLEKVGICTVLLAQQLTERKGLLPPAPCPDWFAWVTLNTLSTWGRSANDSASAPAAQ